MAVSQSSESKLLSACKHSVVLISAHDRATEKRRPRPTDLTMRDGPTTEPWRGFSQRLFWFKHLSKAAGVKFWVLQARPHRWLPVTAVADLPCRYSGAKEVKCG